MHKKCENSTASPWKWRSVKSFTNIFIVIYIRFYCSNIINYNYCLLMYIFLYFLHLQLFYYPGHQPYVPCIFANLCKKGCFYVKHYCKTSENFGSLTSNWRSILIKFGGLTSLTGLHNKHDTFKFRRWSHCKTVSDAVNEDQERWRFSVKSVDELIFSTLPKWRFHV